MTPRRQLFDTFVPLQGRVNFGKGSSAVEGKGTVSVRLSDKNGGCVLRMKNVLFVPDLKFNLVSVGKLTENYVNVSFMTDRAEGIKNDMLVFTADQRSGLFVLESADVMPADRNEGMAMMTELENEDDDVMEAIALKSVSNITWHRYGPSRTLIAQICLVAVNYRKLHRLMVVEVPQDGVRKI
ncbi:hypothetical protein J437_LFUL016088 [Ladona fulva]|uniref:Retrovirus-related Pol polyprotein from transposon TNT 1-94-like beta-barrel domain-containing protein n=1 Tax=Ladona fulva TaxID=123851 RepID=A0A8K0KJQ0_LADFU|nr:hypothetical protein J437_LFUL016088 [Ladona fulva]